MPANELVRTHGVGTLRAAIAFSQCGVRWHALDLLEDVDTGSPPFRRRQALDRAGKWLGTLPPRLALEQEDAVAAVAERCGYSITAVQRAFRARYWNDLEVERGRRVDAHRSLSLPTSRAGAGPLSCDRLHKASEVAELLTVHVRTVLPLRLALEQEDTVRSVSRGCGCSPEAVERSLLSFGARRKRLRPGRDCACGTGTLKMEWRNRP
jgi:hypothetical protein